MKSLFVGGNHDGQRYAVEDGCTEVHFPVHEPVRVIDERPKSTDTFRPVTYRSMKFRGNRDDFTVFAFEDFNADDVMRALLANYVPDAPID
jgi:hypothetical protein